MFGISKKALTQNVRAFSRIDEVQCKRSNSEFSSYRCSQSYQAAAEKDKRIWFGNHIGFNWRYTVGAATIINKATRVVDRSTVSSKGLGAFIQTKRKQAPSRLVVGGAAS